MVFSKEPVASSTPKEMPQVRLAQDFMGKDWSIGRKYGQQMGNIWETMVKRGFTWFYYDLPNRNAWVLKSSKSG
jgi:hypothetical protein